MLKCLAAVILAQFITVSVSGQNASDNFILKEFIEKTLNFYDFNKQLSESGMTALSHTVCAGCALGVSVMLHSSKMGQSSNDLSNLISFLCKAFHIQSPQVCDGVARNFGPDVSHILKNTCVTPDEFCSVLLGDPCKDTFSERNNWQVVIENSDSPIRLEVNEFNPSNPVLKVLHITDTHIDDIYAVGSNAACKDALCCRITDEKIESNASRAGPWGDYRNCDLPRRTMENLLNHINEQHKDIDYIIWTGDLPAHDVWSLTKETNLEIIREGIDQMHKAFPNIPIFPAVGNHETVPINNFPTPPASGVGPSGFNMDWLYNVLDSEWSRWLPPSASRTIRRGAFYSVLLKEGFRIISINSNYCYHLNWWLMLNSADPAGELQWLSDQLQSAEENNERVHIIGHIPPGNSDCIKVWSRNFNAIIERYRNTVMAQFYGHTHFDEFMVQYELNDTSRPVGVAYVGPSVTPFTSLNPAYRIYYVDGDHDATTRAIIDHETWTMNLTEANLGDGPVWYKLYSAKDAYNMSSLSPVDWDYFISDLAEKEEAFAKYYRHYYRDSDVMPVCNDKCRKKITCDARSGRSHDRRSLCRKIDHKIDLHIKTAFKSKLYRDLSLKFIEPFISPQPQN